MIKKFFIYCKYDGIKSAIKFSIKTLISPFYIYSKTDFFRISSPVNVYVRNKSMRIERISSYDINKVENINFPKLKLLNYTDWLNKGSILYIGFIDEKPIAYTWIHYKSYHIHNIGDFILNNNECWIGPSFVDKNYRREGHRRHLFDFQIKDCNAKYFYTSVNTKNIASIKSVEHTGFEKIGTITKRRFLTHITSKISNNIEIQHKLKL